MSEKPCQLDLGLAWCLSCWNGHMNFQERRKELGSKQLTTQDHSQGCQLLGIVFFQSPAEAGGWRGQACHLILDNAACIWIVTVFCGFSVCSPSSPAPTSFVLYYRKERGKGIPSLLALHQDPAGRDGGEKVQQ